MGNQPSGSLAREKYFTRYALVNTHLEKPKENGPFCSVVIPCYNEPDVYATLESLLNCFTPELKWEILIVLNYSENDEQHIKKESHESANNLEIWCKNHSSNRIKLSITRAFELPAKKAGVGLARKIGMDTAASQMKDSGFIICLDADCSVSQNYLTEIENYLIQNPNIEGGSIYFEHPLDSDNSDAIYDYELFLRYFILGQKTAGFKYGHHTVGSAMFIKVSSYFKIGGMNTRKAGEDFYFINKIIKAGKFGAITDATVFPSDRESARVPFGTGKAIIDWKSEKQFITYDPIVFDILKMLLNNIESLYHGGEFLENQYLDEYFKKTDFSKYIKEIKGRSKDQDTFISNFNHWFDGFQFMKLANFLRDEKGLFMEVKQAAKIQLSDLGINHREDSLLNIYRKIDRGTLSY